MGSQMGAGIAFQHFCSESRQQSGVEKERPRFANSDGFEIRVGGVEQEIGLAGDDDAGEFEDRRAGLFHPRIAEAFGGGWRGLVPPPGREAGGREFFDETLVEFDGEDDILEAHGWIQMHQRFESGEGGRGAGVNHPGTGRIPSATVESRAFAGECGGGVGFSDDLKDLSHQE